MAERSSEPERLRAAAVERGLAIHVVAFPDGTRTAQDAATAVGCGVGQIVTSLVARAAGAVVADLAG